MTMEIILFALSASALTVSVIAMLSFFRRLKLSEKEISELRRELTVYTEISIDVAKQLQRTDRGNQALAPKAQSSRRALLSEAQNRLNRGEELLDLSIPLGLSRDEVRLLNRLQRN